jgi:hypothetical protein
MSGEPEKEIRPGSGPEQPEASQVEDEYVLFFLKALAAASFTAEAAQHLHVQTGSAF